MIPVVNLERVGKLWGNKMGKIHFKLQALIQWSVVISGNLIKVKRNVNEKEGKRKEVLLEMSWLLMSANQSLVMGQFIGLYGRVVRFNK